MQTLKTVYYEESITGLYRGLLTHLIRQIPVKYFSRKNFFLKNIFFI
jgi:hypothetical protein